MSVFAKALALNLTFLLGPVGLFYATVTGGFIMMIVPTFLVILLFQQYTLYQIFLMMFSWFAITGVNRYYDRLHWQIKLSENQHMQEESDREFRMQEMYWKNQTMQNQLLSFQTIYHYAHLN